MQRARRLAIVVITAVGLLALSACRSDPLVAAYVGDQKITEDHVTEIVNDLKQQVDEEFHDQLPARAEVVRVLVLGHLCQRLSADKGYQPQSELPAELVAQNLGVSPEASYAQHVAELYTCFSGLPVTSVAPDPDDLAELVAKAKAAGVIEADERVEQAAAQLDGDQLRNALGHRQALADAVVAYDVTVNPRYRPLEFPLLTFGDSSIAVAVPLGEPGSDAVTDAR